MDTKNKRTWVAALKSVQIAAGLVEMPGNQLRDWARSTLAEITSSALTAGELDEISEAFFESVQKKTLVAGESKPVLFQYRTDWKDLPLAPLQVEESRTPRQIGQMASAYFLIEPPGSPPAPFPANPYGSPSNYLLHPSIDVLDQKTITKISSRDTGA
jgi:hypothetical protein